ncbi:tRNA uridine-5-carboxymethylaminomethyl(34) synthesis GTPase MnmE [Desulfomarina sp.]
MLSEKKSQSCFGSGTTSENDTIAAISTPPGAGGIGIIRMSGNRSLDILKMIFVPAGSPGVLVSHHMYYGHIRRENDGKILDEVLAVFMASPRTYTREDVVEIHCHGSYLVLQNVLELLLDQGVRLAEPGEFTKRAFLNGRIDLTRAEAVIDVLAAKTRKGVDLAQEQLSGALYDKIEPVRKGLLNMRAIIEVAIDFPDEDVDIVREYDLQERIVNEVEKPISYLLKQAEQGRVYRDGITVVIAGLPNVGKSSLLNTILQEKRALVTEIPGTTRDSIEEYVDIRGLPVRLIDTAGIREEAGEVVEELGIRRAKELINMADLVLFMVDGSRPLEDGDVALYQSVCHKPILIVINKIDIAGSDDVDLRKLSGDCRSVSVSAREQYNIDLLKDQIFQIITTGTDQWEEGGCAPNLRHKLALGKALDACRRAVKTLSGGLTIDLIAVDLQDCLDHLGDIVGTTTTEDILDVIFEQFCLGK